MKKIVIAALAVGSLFGAAAPAAAQFGFGAHAGVSIPTGDYGDAAELGFGGGLDLVLPLTMLPGLGWYTSADVIAHSVEDIDDGFLYAPLMTGLRFDIPAGPIGLFVNGQVGLVFHQPPDELFGLDDGEWGNDFGFVLGGGARITDNVYAGLKYYPLDLEFETESGTVADADVSFLDIYVGFGVF